MQRIQPFHCRPILIQDRYTPLTRPPPTNQPLWAFSNFGCVSSARTFGSVRCLVASCAAFRVLLNGNKKNKKKIPQLGGGRSLGGIRADGRPQEHPPLVDDVNVLVPIWPGGPWHRPALPLDATGFFIWGDSHRVVSFDPPTVNATSLNML